MKTIEKQAIDGVLTTIDALVRKTKKTCLSYKHEIDFTCLALHRYYNGRT